MTSEVTVSLSLIFAVVAMIGTLINIGNSFRNNNEKETDKRLNIAEQFAMINVKLDSMGTSMSDLAKENGRSRAEIQEINKALILQHERLETLFKYKDNHEERIKDLEHCSDKSFSGKQYSGRDKP